MSSKVPGRRLRRGAWSSAAPVGAALLLAITTGACGPAPGRAARSAAPQTAVERGSLPAYVTPATVFATTDPAAVTVSRVEPDGRRLLISHGMRLEQRRDGSLERAAELLPSKDALQIEALPPRLGGGYLFYVTSANATLVWFAREFTGKLTPLANLDFSVERIVPGFDRLYLLRARSKLPIAIDAETGQALDLGPLPDSPSYESLAFADAWMGVVAVPLRGVLASFDAGASWHPVPSATRVTQSDRGPVLRTETGWGVLTPEGVLRSWDAPGDQLERLAQLLEALGEESKLASETGPESEARRTPKRPLGSDPLRVAILHGVMGPEGSAYVAHAGTLARVRLRDGKLLDAAPHSFPANSDCHGVRLGKGFGFVCSQERGKTQIYALEQPLALRSVLAFEEPRYVADSEHGGLVIRGRCSSASEPEPGFYCLLSEHGLREVKVRGDVGAERVALFADGSAAVIVPPRKGSVATLTRVDLAGTSTQLKLELPKSGPVASLLREGIWLDGFRAGDKGELSGWVAGAGPFVGIRIERDGKVVSGEVQNDIERALISGRFALLKAQYGQALQTVDAGQKWLDVPTLEVPSRKDDAPQLNLEQGCSPIGCATEQWLRVGWSTPKEASRSVEAAPPERTRLPSPGGGRWTMHCYASGLASPRALIGNISQQARDQAEHVLSRAAAQASAAGPELEGTAWQPFFETAAPRLPHRHLGFDLAVEYGNQWLHGYVWGQRGANWEQSGKFLIRVLNRFAVEDGIWSSHASRSPWPDEMSAAAAFGEGASGGSSTWQFELEPSGREGLLLVRQQPQTELFVVAEGRAITPIRGAELVTRTSGVVKLGSTWHFGAPTDNGFSVFKIVGDRIVLLGSYAFDEGRSGLRAIPELIRNSKADALALTLLGVSRYIYPINLRDGSLQAPLVIAPKELASLPPSCSGDEDGFTFIEQIRVAPYVELMGAAAAVNAAGVEAHFTLGAGGLCIEGLAARASAILPESLARGGAESPRAPQRAPVSMVLSEQGSASRRWHFDCFP